MFIATSEKNTISFIFLCKVHKVKMNKCRTLKLTTQMKEVCIETKTSMQIMIWSENDVVSYVI